MDAHANVRFDPLNMADAAANLNIILKGNVENQLQPNVTDERDILRRTGNYSLSSSLAVIKVVPPTRR